MSKILAGIEFRTQSAISDHARKIKEKYRDGERIDGNDHRFLCAFIALHCSADEKIGCGIQYFTIQQDQRWKNSRQFVLVRTDGSRAIFSHNKLGTVTEEEWHRKKVLAAMREAIREQTNEFRKENYIPGVTRCPLTNEIIEEPHVDHMKPQTFEALAAAWLKSESLQFADVQVSSDSDNRTYVLMSNVEQFESWLSYHALHANLRILSKRANLSLARR
jgi:hypothetical protein